MNVHVILQSVSSFKLLLAAFIWADQRFFIDVDVKMSGELRFVAEDLIAICEGTTEGLLAAFGEFFAVFIALLGCWGHKVFNL